MRADSQQALELRDRSPDRLAVPVHEIIEVEASLHVLDGAAHLAAVDRQRRQRLRPGLGEMVRIVVLAIVVQNFGRPGLGAERDMPALVECDEARGAP